MRILGGHNKTCYILETVLSALFFKLIFETSTQENLTLCFFCCCVLNTRKQTYSQSIFVFFLNWCFVLLLQILQIHSLFNCTPKLCVHCFSSDSHCLLWKLFWTQKKICIHATICKVMAKWLDYFNYQCHLVDKSGKWWIYPHGKESKLAYNLFQLVMLTTTCCKLI